MPEETPNAVVPVAQLQTSRLLKALQIMGASSREIDRQIDAYFHGEAAPKVFVPFYTGDERVAKGLYRNPSSWSTHGTTAVLECDGREFIGNGRLLAPSCCAAAILAFERLRDGPVYLKRFFP